MSNEQQRTDVPNEEHDRVNLSDEDIAKVKKFVLMEVKVFAIRCYESSRKDEQQEHDVTASFLGGMLFILTRIQGYNSQIACNAACNMAEILLGDLKGLAAMADRPRAEQED